MSLIVRIALIVGGTIAGIVATSYFQPPATGEAGSPAGTPADGLLSRQNVEWAATILGLVASVTAIWMFTRGK